MADNRDGRDPFDDNPTEFIGGGRGGRDAGRGGPGGPGGSG
ncbi:MAG TPA: 30S ribosomal protein S18, partial [Actinomycetales bacterium]|nr:30S ribosomal protein S18 [Actinomycetales bacterium]